MLAWAASAKKGNAGVMSDVAVFASMLNAGLEMMHALGDGAQHDHGHAG